MRLFSWLVDRWRARQRALDMQILWPLCCKHAPDLATAKMAFAVHAFADPAWLHLGNKGIFMIIDSLECPK
jgi:hypothetical protein